MRKPPHHAVYSILLFWLANALGIAMGDNEVSGSSNATGYLLDLANRTRAKTIGQEVATPQAMKFVHVEVAEVFNPRKIPISFSVHYQSPGGEKYLLGTFSLFPPDNPGRFIVATRGKLRRGGMIIVSLVPLADVDEAAKLRVWLKPLSFIGD